MYFLGINSQVTILYMLYLLRHILTSYKHVSVVLTYAFTYKLYLYPTSFFKWRAYVYVYLSPFSKLDRRHTWKIETAWWREKGQGGGRGAESDDGKKAWPSINHSILCFIPCGAVYELGSVLGPPWELGQKLSVSELSGLLQAWTN
jgi:hypothetical protein